MPGIPSFARALSRHPRYAALNVFGLATGIAVFLVLGLVVQYERGFDRWLPDAANIYRLDTTWSMPGRAPQEAADTSFVALGLLRTDFPQIQAGTRMMEQTAPVSVGNLVDSEDVTYVDPNFLETIRLPLLLGNRAEALASATSVVVARTIAEKYFGTAQALGRSLTISQDGTKRLFTVSGVLEDLPHDTSLHIDIIAPFTPAVEQGVRAFHKWGSSSGTTYLRFRTPGDARGVAAALHDFVARRAAGDGNDQLGTDPQNHYALSLIALPDVHFHDLTVDAPKPGADRRIVYSLGAVGLLALTTAVINYINLATARAGLRAREVALRKVMGATRRALVLQFLAEATVLVALAALIGLAMTELAVPAVNALGGWAVHIDYAQIVPLLLGLVLLVGVVAGLYPAWLLAAYQPAQVLASARMPAGGRMGARLRNLLVLAQFASAIAFSISTLVIDGQAAFLRNAARGFDRQGLIIVASVSAQELMGRQAAILDAMRGVPGVVSATVSDREPNSNSTSATGIRWPGMVGPHPSIVHETVGRDYLATYGIQLLAGRAFDDAHRADDLAGKFSGGRTTSAMVNRAALAALGLSDPQAAIGRRFANDSLGGQADHVIIGVVENVRFMSPREPVAAQFYTYDTHAFEDAQAAIRFRGVPREQVMQGLQAAWRQVVPGNPFVAQTADERLAEFYRPDQQRAGLFSAGAALAIAIACLGLYGLASFNTARRTCEIGIRKTLGASTTRVLLLLVGQFIRPVVLANVIAWPVAWVVMRAWLSGFDQRIALSPLVFAGASLVAIVLAVLTVLGQALRVARAEPARALRHE